MIAPQAAPDKGDPGQSKKQAQLAQSIGNQNIRFTGQRLTNAALGHRQAASAQALGYFAATFWMARHQDRDHGWNRFTQFFMGFCNDIFLPRMGAGRQPNRATFQHSLFC